MPVERFNDLASSVGPVARTGSLAGSEPAGARPSATGLPSGVRQSDGVDSPRVTVVTRSAALPTTAAGRDRNPAQRFGGGSV